MTTNRVTNTIAEEVTKMWGGRTPTWEEFKQASRDGRVRVNKSIAAQAIFLKGMPIAYKILYGVITIWAGFLALPIVLIAYFIAKFSFLWVLGAAIASYFLIKVSREGHCEGIKAGAENNEDLYSLLFNNGAFLFGPPHK